MLGITKVKARCGETELYVSIHVVDEGGPNLMGRDWLGLFDVKLKDINAVTQPDQLDVILDQHAEVFKDELGCMPPVKLQVHEGATTKFLCPFPYYSRTKQKKNLKVC